MRDLAQQRFLKSASLPSKKQFSEGICRKADSSLQRFTKPLLYQLSYVGAPSGEDYIETIRQQAAEFVRSLGSGELVRRSGP